MGVTSEIVPDNILGLVISEYATKIGHEINFDDDVIINEGDEIVKIYEDSDVKIHSCMTGADSKNVEMYALNPDKVKLVTYKNLARALLWTCDDGTKVLDRSYPAGTQFIKLLRGWAKKNNFVLRDNPDQLITGNVHLSDNKVHTITMAHKGVFPYLDTFHYGTNIEGDYSDEGTIELSNYKNEDTDYLFNGTEGDLTLNREECYKCEQRIRRGDSGGEYNGNFYCSDCWVENFVECNGCNETLRINSDDIETGADENIYCSSCFVENFATCCECGEVERKNDIISTVDDDPYCVGCSEKYLEQCPKCDDWVLKERIINVETMDKNVEPLKMCESCVSFAEPSFPQCDKCKKYVNYPLVKNFCYDCYPGLYTGQYDLPYTPLEKALNRFIKKL